MSRRSREDNVTTDIKQLAAATPPDDKAPASHPAVTKAKTTAKRKPTSRLKASAKAQSKQDRVLTMLRQKEGATVAVIVKSTGWQPHSVRGFFAGVVRKKLELNLTSKESDGKRIYRIDNAKRAAPSRAKRKRAN